MSLTAAIQRLITAEKIATQSDLVERLKAQGIIAKQSSISRALARLNAVKGLDKNGKPYYRILGARYIPQNLVLEIIATETLIVIHTRTGAASHIAQLLDEVHLPDKAGTIAGDNTIFIATKTLKSIPQLVKKLSEHFGLED